MRAVHRLIVNADDLGLTDATTAGIVHAHRHGIVTSASLMVRQPAAAAAVRAAAAAGLDDLGLHLDLGEQAFREGRWQPLYEVVNRDDRTAVAAECRAQLDAFRRLVGREPTHLDSHQHVHLDEPVRSVAVAMAAELGVPLRHLTPGVRHCGGFYGQSGRGEPAADLLSAEALLDLLARERDARGPQPAAAVELGCHPGWDADLDTMYVGERRVEVEVLCSPGLPQAIAALGYELATFVDLACGPSGEPRT
jgi:predicted glycoside hydrolase/deacetylase ChbG (UPF0249 family)